MVARPAAADLLLADAKLPPGGAFTMQVAVECRTRQAATELMSQDAIDHHVAPLRLFLLQFDRSVQQVLLPGSRAAAITAPAAAGSLDALLAEPLPPAPERAHGDPLPPTIGQQSLFGRQRAEVRLALRFRNFSQMQGAEERAPKDGPGLIVTIHKVLLPPRMFGTREGARYLRGRAILLRSGGRRVRGTRGSNDRSEEASGARCARSPRVARCDVYAG